MGFARTCLTTPTVCLELVEGLSNSVLWIDFVDLVSPLSAWAICQPAVGGGGKGEKAQYPFGLLPEPPAWCLYHFSKNRT